MQELSDDDDVDEGVCVVLLRSCACHTFGWGLISRVLAEWSDVAVRE